MSFFDQAKFKIWIYAQPSQTGQPSKWKIYVDEQNDHHGYEIFILMADLTD